jgi:Mrp family chromosome partitioning ATPase
MNAEDREIIVRPDALAVLGRNAGDSHRNAPGDETERAPAHRSAPYQAVQLAKDANGERGAGRLGLISDKELKHLVTAQFEYPPLRQGTGGYSVELAAAFNPYSAKGRSLRYLAARILLEAYTKDGLCFSVAGAHPGCGATYIAANLGVVFSELGLRTLIIDANLKRPRLHTVFNWPQDGGLATMIAGNASPSSYVAPLGQFRDLSFLPAGRRAVRMSSRLGNGVLANTLVALRQAYDVIICDSPSASSNAYDGCEVVAGMCGNTVSVFRKNRTGVSRARSLLASLDAVGTRQIGSVLCEH